MRINYEFKNKALLRTALTHISLANENNIESNQRLEFLGDSVLSFIIATKIYDEYKHYNEGLLTELRAVVVCEKALSKAARSIDLGSGIKFGKSEAKCGGKDKDSILADTFEAVLAAIFLDGGIESARKWALETLKVVFDDLESIDIKNYKSEIQSYFQKRDKGTDTVTYNLLTRTGPEHAPTFEVEAIYRDKVIGRGKGSNRKSAEQQAAKQAFESLDK